MIPRVRIAHLPTPIENLERLSKELGGPQILVKRDDLTGLAFGGNKTRKLETLLAEAQAQGAEMLITAGAIQSNHCRQTAAAAARFGMKCILVLSGTPAAVPNGNLLLDHLLGAELVWCQRDERDNILDNTYALAVKEGRKPFLIPYGGSNPTGAAAYALAFQEFLEQKQDVDWIVFPSSSGGTQAGLAAGAKMAHWMGKVLGISVDEPAGILQERVAHLAGEVTSCFGKTLSFALDEILVNDQYLGEGYAVMGPAEREAIALFARCEGLLLDPVYTGRAAAGLIDLARKKYFKPKDRVLFWHTGGTPALFAPPYPEQLI